MVSNQCWNDITFCYCQIIVHARSEFNGNSGTQNITTDCKILCIEIMISQRNGRKYFSITHNWYFKVARNRMKPWGIFRLRSSVQNTAWKSWIQNYLWKTEFSVVTDRNSMNRKSNGNTKKLLFRTKSALILGKPWFHMNSEKIYYALYTRLPRKHKWKQDIYSFGQRRMKSTIFHRIGKNETPHYTKRKLSSYQ